MPNAIILLHGTSSTGKTSTARTLQQLFPLPLVYFSLDGWITQGLSPRFYEPAKSIAEIKKDPEVKQGTHFLLPNTAENPMPWPMVGSGKVADDAIEVMYQAVLNYYQRGYWVILDHVFIKPLWRDEFLEATTNCRRFLVKMTCSDDILAAREKARGDRMANVYLSLAQVIHQGIDYDFTINTGIISPTQSAEQILNFPKIKELLYNDSIINSN